MSVRRSAGAQNEQAAPDQEPHSFQQCPDSLGASFPLAAVASVSTFSSAAGQQCAGPTHLRILAGSLDQVQGWILKVPPSTSPETARRRESGDFWTAAVRACCKAYLVSMT